jgi:hypothetical protein
MEPRGCNRWQPVANRIGAETSKTSQTVAVSGDRLPIAAHGKGRVDSTSLLLKRGSPSSLRKKKVGSSRTRRHASSTRNVSRDRMRGDSASWRTWCARAQRSVFLAPLRRLRPRLVRLEGRAAGAELLCLAPRVLETWSGRRCRRAGRSRSARSPVVLAVWRTLLPAAPRQFSRSRGRCCGGLPR